VHKIANSQREPPRVTDREAPRALDQQKRSNTVPRSRGLDVLLVTSGLGPRYGGIGCVSRSIRDILGSRWNVRAVTSPPEWPPLRRRARLWSSLLANTLRRPRLVLYEHRGLARIHPWLPWPGNSRYGILLHGCEVWSPVSPSQRGILERADCVLAFSQTTVDEARRHNPWLPPVPVVHLGIEVPPARVLADSPGNLLVLVSRIDAGERYKGHDEILDAWPATRRGLPRARFVAIGGGSDLERLRQRVRSEHLEGVEFTGFVTGEERTRWLQRATAAFALSRREGFGLANVEAAAMGLPLIGLPHTVLEELFPPDTGVRFVPSLRARDIAETVIELLREPDRAAELGAQGRAHVLSHYTHRHFQERLLSTFGAALQPESGVVAYE
jgi:phosphatidylinositol alpha-1,6-mannosyltransferase